MMTPNTLLTATLMVGLFLNLAFLCQGEENSLKKYALFIASAIAFLLSIVISLTLDLSAGSSNVGLYVFLPCFCFVLDAARWYQDLFKKESLAVVP